MTTIRALACAGLNRLPDGEWRLHSRFSQAINFCHRDGEMLTLYRYGKGMGPAGVLLTTAHFSRVTPLNWLIKRGNILRGQALTLCARRTLRMSLSSVATVPVDLTAYTQPSGLFGALNHPLTTLSFYSEIITQLERWREGVTPDWRGLIGYGQGLTPSGDDMLTGMLAVLHAAGFSAQLPPFLPPADQLAQLTTSVSCSYLNSARAGEFSTTVQKVIRHLQPGRDPQPAIKRLLSVGHTSGADTLLGIAIAQRWLQNSDSRGNHARSGNNTHFYSSGGDGEFFPRSQFAP